jgi:hypothetical protein
MDNFNDTPEPTPEPIQSVLIGTGSGRRSRQKIPKPSDGTYRAKITTIPKRLEALYILFADTRDEGNGLTLTREELDMNPATAKLDTPEKNALVKFWPKFKENLDHAREIRKLREEEVALTTKGHKNAAAIEKREGMLNLSLPEQMKVTAKVYDRTIQSAALVLAGTAVETLHTDKASLEMWRVRVQAIKDLAWVREKISDLADRIEKEATGEILTLNAQTEAFNILQNADMLLLRKGSKG